MQLNSVKKEAREQGSYLKKEALHLKKILQSEEIVQVKTDAIAILLRKMGREEEFVAEFDKLTKEGYRMILREEIKEFPISSGFNIQLGTLYYFQNVKYIP